MFQYEVPQRVLTALDEPIPRNVQNDFATTTPIHCGQVVLPGQLAYLAKSGLEVTSGIMFPATELMPVMKAQPRAEDEVTVFPSFDASPKPRLLPTIYPKVAIRTCGARTLLIV
jgi:hypothetical protein